MYDGACGHNFATWGNPAFAEGAAGGGGGGDAAAHVAAPVPPHEADGWAVEELPDASRWMLSRFASDEDECVCHSAAVAFRRVVARD